MHFFWGIIQNYLLLPSPLRIIIALVFIVAILLFIWNFIKYIPILTIMLLIVLNKFVTMVNRRLICTIGKKNQNVYNWDEEIGRFGRTIDSHLNISIDWLKKSTWHQLLSKKCICILTIIYLLAIFPSLPLKYVIDEYYLEHMYGINRVFVHFEKILEEKAEGYPPIFDLPQFKGDSDQVIHREEPPTETEKRQIFLQLNQSTYYANVRESPAKSGEKVCVVGRDDTLVYQNEYISDSERCWLKVIVESQNNLEGWISSKVIDNSILNELNLY